MNFECLCQSWKCISWTPWKQRIPERKNCRTESSWKACFGPFYGNASILTNSKNKSRLWQSQVKDVFRKDGHNIDPLHFSYKPIHFNRKILFKEGYNSHASLKIKFKISLSSSIQYWSNIMLIIVAGNLFSKCILLIQLRKISVNYYYSFSLHFSSKSACTPHPQLGKYPDFPGEQIWLSWRIFWFFSKSFPFFRQTSILYWFLCTKYRWQTALCSLTQWLNSWIIPAASTLSRCNFALSSIYSPWLFNANTN